MEAMINVCLVGGYAKSFFLDICSPLPINSINQVNVGSLGNFKTINYELIMCEDKIFSVRKAIINELSKRSEIEVLLPFNDPMRIYIFKKFA